MCVFVLWPYHNVKYRLLRGIYFQVWKQEEKSMYRDVVSSCRGPFSYLIAYAAFEVRCAVPLVSDLPDVVIYDWHSDSCVLSCSGDVDRD